MNTIKRVFQIMTIGWISLLPLIGQDLPRVSVLTCAPGKEIYSIYGHNAIRLRYDDQRDYVFNYGTFDFQTPNFTLKFLRGKLPYHLTAAHFNDFLREYEYFNRSVSEQILNFDSTEISRVVDFLENNMKPENRAYKYDFFKDNCATRVYDVLQTATSQNIRWENEQKNQNTFRSIIHYYQRNFPWTNFGIDLIIGSYAERKITYKEEMFIPDFVQKHLSRASFKNQPVVKQKESLLTYATHEIHPAQNFLMGPLFIFLLILIYETFLFYRGVHRNIMGKWTKYHDKAWFILLLTIAIVIVIMWFLTDHTPTKTNWNLIWTLPAIGYFFNKVLFNKSFVVGYLILLTLTLINSFQVQLLPQFFHPVFGIMSLITILKLIRNYRGQHQQTGIPALNNT